MQIIIGDGSKTYWIAHIPVAKKTSEGLRLAGDIDYMFNGGRAGFYCVLCSNGKNQSYPSSLDYVKRREQFGKKIAQFQVTQHKLAEMATQIEQVRYLSYAAAKSFDSRKPDYKLAAIAKDVIVRIK